MMNIENMEQLDKEEIITDYEQRIAALTRQVDEAVAHFTTDYEEHERALRSNLQQANEDLDELREADADHFLLWHPRIKTLKEEIDQLLEQTARVLKARTPESIGWATGQAEWTEHESEGWVEGMGHQEEDSAGWLEGQGKRGAESKGWTEGMGETGR